MSVSVPRTRSVRRRTAWRGLILSPIASRSCPRSSLVRSMSALTCCALGPFDVLLDGLDGLFRTQRELAHPRSGLAEEDEADEREQGGHAGERRPQRHRQVEGEHDGEDASTTARYPAKPAAPNMLPAFAVCRTSSLISILASSTSLRNNVARSLLVLEMSSTTVAPATALAVTRSASIGSKSPSATSSLARRGLHLRKHHRFSSTRRGRWRAHTTAASVVGPEIDSGLVAAGGSIGCFWPLLGARTARSCPPC